MDPLQLSQLAPLVADRQARLRASADAARWRTVPRRRRRRGTHPDQA